MLKALQVTGKQGSDTPRRHPCRACSLSARWFQADCILAKLYRRLHEKTILSQEEV